MYFVFTYSINLFIDIGMIFYYRFLIVWNDPTRTRGCAGSRETKAWVPADALQSAVWVGAAGFIGARGGCFTSPPHGRGSLRK